MINRRKLDFLGLRMYCCGLVDNITSSCCNVVAMLFQLFLHYISRVILSCKRQIDCGKTIQIIPTNKNTSLSV